MLQKLIRQMRQIRQMFRPRFSLKVLLVLAAVVGIGLIPLVQRMDRARRQKELVQHVIRHGGEVRYRWQEGSDAEDNRPRGFARRLFGNDFFDEVQAVNIDLTGTSNGSTSGLSERADEAFLNELRVLAGLQFLELSFDGSFDPASISGLTKLEWLRISDSPKFEDLSPISNLTKLKLLSLRNTNVHDLTPLEPLTELEALDLRETSVADLTALKSLGNIKSLLLEGTDISDLTPLDSLTNLTHAELERTRVYDLTPLALPNLEILTLRSTRVTSLEPLHSVKSLRQIFTDKLPDGPSKEEREKLKAALPNLYISEL